MPIVKELKQHKILLDTHVWIWVTGGNSILSLFMIPHRNSLDIIDIVSSRTEGWFFPIAASPLDCDKEASLRL